MIKVECHQMLKDSKAGFEFENEEAYLQALLAVLKVGQDTGDRTNTGMRSLFGVTMRFNLECGFPLITTKKMFTKGVFQELLWFLSGSTSNTELEERGVKFWKEWEENGELPNIYGKQWTRFEASQKIVKIPRKFKEKEGAFDYRAFELLAPENKLDKNNFVGNVFPSKNHGDFIVLDFENSYDKELNPKGTMVYKIQFLITGFIKENVNTNSLKNGKVEDPFYPSVEGVGFLGMYHNDTSDDLTNHLKTVWRHMINRCYSVNHKSYHNYGGKGVFVDQRWFNFSNFLDDVKKLPNWHLKKNNIGGYNLDKDYFGSNCYSKDTCVWLTISDNVLYSLSKPFYLIQNQDKKIFISKTECGKFINVDDRRVGDILNKSYVPKKYGNIVLEYLDYDEENYVYRYELPFNQIEYVINEIKTNPNSRRILFTGWNAPEMQWDDTALPCCHSTVVQFYVREGKYLDMYHYQRSGDMFLGVPVNIASYATLLTMIAQQCDLIPGFMTHTIGVAHIYNNHIDQVKEQLSRSIYGAPSLIINRKPDSIFDYKFEDFEIVDYQHHPLIKGVVAI